MLKKIKKLNFKKLNIKQTPQNYAKIGIVAAAVIAVAAIAMYAMAPRGGASLERALAGVSTESVSGADLRIAIVRMDEIQMKANVLTSLRQQKESFESRLRDELTRTQRQLEREKDEIEKSQGMLSQEALQRRVMEFQQKVTQLQRDTTERAQAIDVEFQRALVEIQRRDLDPVIEGIIQKKELSIVIDGRFARISPNAPAGLDITDEVIAAMNKKASSFKMARPKGF